MGWDFFSGDQGSSAAKADTTNKALSDLQAGQAAQGTDAMQELLRRVSRGELSPEDAAKQAAQSGGDAGKNRQIFMNMMANDPGASGKLAQSQMMSDPSLKGLFGENGLSSQAQSQYGKYGQMADKQAGNLDQDRNALSGRDPSFGLQSSDLKAYGQASTNLGHMFAGQQQNLAQSLADRGLGAAPSGVANKAFATQFGNQNEQLANLQNQIAQQRIQTAQGLAQARTNADLQAQGQAMGAQAQQGSLANSLAQTGQSAENAAAQRAMEGANNQFNQQTSLAGLNMNNTAQQQNINNSQWAQQQQSKSPGFGEMLGKGIATGISGGISGGLSNLASMGISGQDSSGESSSGSSKKSMAGGLGLIP